MTKQLNVVPDKAATLVVHPTAGVGDATTIEDAIALLPTAGGDIFVREGTYAPSTTIALPDKDIRIRGAGAVGITQITIPTGVPLFSVASTNTADYDLSGFKAVGDDSASQSLISISAPVTVWFADVEVEDTRDIIVTSSYPTVIADHCYVTFTSSATTTSFWRGSVTAGGASTTGFNNTFASAGLITGTAITVTGSNVAATKEANEPNHGGNAGGASVWVKWVAPADSQVTINTVGSDFDTLLAVYTGTTVSTLTTIASDDDGAAPQSTVTFHAEEGVTYYIAVDGFGGATGNITLNLGSHAGTPTLVWHYTSTTWGTASTDGIVGEPDWHVVDSYIGGGGPTKTTCEVGKAVFTGFRFDKMILHIYGEDTAMVNVDSIDTITFLRNFRSSVVGSSFTSPTLSDNSMLICEGAFSPLSETGTTIANANISISGCVFNGFNLTFDAIGVETEGVAIAGCSFLNCGSGNGTDAAITAGSFNPASLTVSGCSFKNGDPDRAIYEFNVNPPKGTYVGNLGFGDSNIVGNSSVDGVLFTQTASATIASTVAETTLTAAGKGNRTMPANFLHPGKIIRILAQGVVSDTGTPTYRVRIKFGSTLILDTGTVSFTGTISNNKWAVEATITCRTAGVSGTVIGQGSFEEVPDNRAGMTNTAAVTVDTTIAETIDVTWEWGTSSSSNTITCTNLVIEEKY